MQSTLKLAALIDALAAVDNVPHVNFESIKNILAPYLSQMDWLGKQNYQFDTDGISRQLVYQAPNNGLAIMVIAWQPGISVKPHNHYSWGVIGCLQGIEKNVFWQTTADANNAVHLAPVREIICQAGDTIAFLPEDIHSVSNIGEGFAVALHIYGQLNAAGCSTYQVFDAEASTAKVFENSYA